jgi:hypothetical protein
MYQNKLDIAIKEWAVSSPYNDMEHPNEMTNVVFNPEYWKEGDVFISFDRV